MTWAWLAVSEAEEVAAAEVATASDALVTVRADPLDGGPGLVLAIWPAGPRPLRHAVRFDADVVDPDGPAATVSLVLVPRGREPLFDDPAVSHAMRRVLADPPDAVTTFSRDSSHFAGSLTVRRRDLWVLRDDPFARLHPARLLAVPAGVFAEVARPAGPVVQRYAGQPWPAAGFTP